MKKEFSIQGRCIGEDHPPLVIPEVGINHEGNLSKALELVEAAAKAGAECIKFQCHITEAEMIPTDMKPGQISQERLWDIIKRCELTEQEERLVMDYCRQRGLIYFSTPFSREAADRLYAMGVPAFKIGSGECNNFPLLEHMAKMGKPIILSTGMNDIESIRKSVEVIQKYNCPLMLMHCTSMYPTPYNKVRLNAVTHLRETFGLPVGLSDHSIGIYTCLGAVSLGACVLEKHFTISRSWPGPDISISIEPQELNELIRGSRAIFEARGGKKDILPEEKPVIDFAYACVVSIKNIRAEESFTRENIWVKRPGNGPLLAKDFERILGKKSRKEILANTQIHPEDIIGF